VDGFICGILQEVLGIYKYEEPEKVFITPGGQKVKYRDNPEFRVYTKFPNVKNAPGYFGEDELVYIQRKIHGTNFRCGIVPVLKQGLWNRILAFFGKKLPSHEFVYGSHRVNISYRNNYTGFYNSDVYGECTKKYDLEKKLWDFFNTGREVDVNNLNSIEVYGEIYGEGVQGNPYKLKGQTVKFFNVFDIDKQEYLGIEFAALIHKLGLETVPIITENFTLPNTIDKLLVMAEGKSFLNRETEREGFVVRSLDRKISFKVISNKFLLGEK